MKKYEVRIYLNSLSYEVEAESEEKAIEYAEEIFYEETMYDLIKRADYEINELEGASK